MIRWSDKMPSIDYKPPISDLFANFALNWSVISPAVTLVVGILFGSWLIKKIIKTVKEDRD